MQGGFDFHTHSWYSYDAHLSPHDLFAAAAEAGLGALAITDHHNMDGFEAFAASARQFPQVAWVPSMEASVATEWGGFDVVCLGVGRDAPGRLASVVDLYRDWMRRHNATLLKGLAAIGVPFGPAEAEKMLATWRPGPARETQGEVRLPNVGLRRWLAEKGCIADESQFAPLTAKAMAAAGGRPNLPTADGVLPAFREAGAVTLIAHPRKLLDNLGEAEFARLVETMGLDGIEAGHTLHSPAQVAQYLAFARSHGLLVSGGSDTHFPESISAIGKHVCEPADAEPLLSRLGL